MSVYDDLDDTVKAKRIYFYMIEEDGGLTEYYIRSVTYIPYSDMPRIIRELAKEVDDGTLPPSKSSRGRRRWKRLSYFVYYHRTGGLLKNNAVTFTSQDGDNNVCFRDGADLIDSGKVYAFYCINHLKKPGGDIGEGEKKRFKIHVNHNRTTVSADRPEQKAVIDVAPGLEEIMTHNDSGTNTGPPVP